MKKYIPILLLIFTLTACNSGTEIPLIEPIATPTSIQTTAPTIAPTRVKSTPTLEIALPTVVPTQTMTDQRFSSSDGMPQILIPAGTFHMGGYDVRAAPDEFPDHDVTLSAYWMDQLEVTNAMYLLCVKAGVCTPPQNFGSQRRTDYFNNPDFNDYPVVYVTWGQANTYCTWANRRLPTEAEWERAARGDDMRTFPWGENKPDYRFANFNFMVRDTTRVGTYPLGASPYGILDMAGNVAEWTNDLYKSNYYSNSDSTNPTGPVSNSSFNRVVRGGSLGDAEINIRVAKRSSVPGSDLEAVPGSSAYLGEVSPRIGFRCAQDD